MVLPCSQTAQTCADRVPDHVTNRCDDRDRDRYMTLTFVVYTELFREMLDATEKISAADHSQKRDACEVENVCIFFIPQEGGDGAEGGDA